MTNRKTAKDSFASLNTLRTAGQGIYIISCSYSVGILANSDYYTDGLCAAAYRPPYNQHNWPLHFFALHSIAPRLHQITVHNDKIILHNFGSTENARTQQKRSISCRSDQWAECWQLTENKVMDLTVWTVTFDSGQ